MFSVGQWWLVGFIVLWAGFFADEEWKHWLKTKCDEKYKKTLENINRLEKWHDENP